MATHLTQTIFTPDLVRSGIWWKKMLHSLMRLLGSRLQLIFTTRSMRLLKTVTWYPWFAMTPNSKRCYEDWLDQYQTSTWCSGQEHGQAEESSCTIHGQHCEEGGRWASSNQWQPLTEYCARWYITHSADLALLDRFRTGSRFTGGSGPMSCQHGSKQSFQSHTYANIWQFFLSLSQMIPTFFMYHPISFPLYRPSDTYLFYRRFILMDHVHALCIDGKKDAVKQGLICIKSLACDTLSFAKRNIPTIVTVAGLRSCKSMSINWLESSANCTSQPVSKSSKISAVGSCIHCHVFISINHTMLLNLASITLLYASKSLYFTSVLWNKARLSRL